MAEEAPKRKRGRPPKPRPPEELNPDGTLKEKPKRKRGRPPKAQGQDKIGMLPMPKFFRKKKVNPKPLNDSLPGTGLAGWLISKSKKPQESIEKEQKKKKKQALTKKTPVEQANAESDKSFANTPSWKPREWVTSSGERLIIKGSAVVKEDQSQALDSEISNPTVNQEQVDEVIRKIRFTYTKKKDSKKKDTKPAAKKEEKKAPAKKEKSKKKAKSKA